MEPVDIDKMRQNLSRYAQCARDDTLLEALPELPAPIPGPPSSLVLDDLRAERL